MQTRSSAQKRARDSESEQGSKPQSVQGTPQKRLKVSEAHSKNVENSQDSKGVVTPPPKQRIQEHKEEAEIEEEKKSLREEKPDRQLIQTNKKPLMFKILKRFNRCRAAIMTLPHGDVRTPVYMPVGTKGGMKGITSDNMDQLIDCDIMLSNTYHLFLKPGEEIMEEMGGLHKFENWNRNILTDSGGFQIVSLGELNSLDEEGVSFKSHIDGKEFKLTPERSMEIQNKIGSDIMMALDDVVPPTTQGERVEEAMERSVRWLDRCIQAHKNTDRQNLFGIIQGGVNDDLRKRCCELMSQRNLNGYAIGGLAGGEDKDDFWRTVKVCTDLLPDDKPRYVMGIGYAEDLVICSLLGADMFDCVFATRTARFGTVFSKYGMIKIKKEEYKEDYGPLSEDCTCYTCKNYTRAYLYYTFKADQSCLHLLSIHNIHYLIHLLRALREAVLLEKAEQFSREFFQNYYRDDPKGVPQWIKNALVECGITL